MRPRFILPLTFLLMYCSLSMAGTEDWRIALCISADPAHQMNVAWRTAEEMGTPLVQLVHNTPQVTFGDAPLEYAAERELVILPDSSRVYAYSVRMTDLQPATSYAYRVGQTDTWSEWLVFRTAETMPAPFRFLYFGDPQNGLLSHVPRALRTGFSAAPDAAFITMAGDLVSNPESDRQWEDLFHGASWIFAQTPLAPVMGNHAFWVGGGWSKQFSKYWPPHFTLPENGLPELGESNYFFHYENLLFVVLNGTILRAEQAVWLDSILSIESSQWIVVSMHQPLYATTDGRSGEKLREHFLPVFDRYQVDLVLQGHDHTFGRTFPLKADKRVSGREKGTIYINSVSGSKQYELNPARSELFAVTGAQTQYYHIIEVGPREMMLRSYSVDGSPVDEVRIKPARRN